MHTKDSNWCYDKIIKYDDLNVNPTLKVNREKLVKDKKYTKTSKIFLIV